MHNQNLKNPQNPNLNSNSTPPETKMEPNKSNYKSINPNNFDEESPPGSPIYRKPLSFSRFTWFLIFLCALIAAFVVVVLKHFGSTFIRKEIIPVIHWLNDTCSQSELAVVLFGAIALFPLLLLPSVPFKWIAGMVFGYGLGFLLIMGGVAVAMSLPFFIASHLFLQKIQEWLKQHPEKAAIVRLAGDGDWFHQFQAVVLLRLSPFPYVVFNYVAVVTGVKYSPYLVGSLVGIIPEVFFAIYSGKLLRTVAEAMEDHTHISKFRMIFDAIGFCLSAASTVIIGFYSKRKLEELQMVE